MAQNDVTADRHQTPYRTAQLWAKSSRGSTPKISNDTWSCGCVRATGKRNISMYQRDSLSWCLDGKGQWALSPKDTELFANQILQACNLSRFAGPGMGLPTGNAESQAEKQLRQYKDVELPRSVPSAKREARKDLLWAQLQSRLPTACAGMGRAAALKPRQPIQFAPRATLGAALNFWKKHPKLLRTHAPAASFPGNDRPIRGWPSRNDEGKGTPPFYFNDIVELMLLLKIVARDINGDDFPEEIKSQLVSAYYSSHVSWHIRATARYAGLELAEVLGSFDHQAAIDRQFWDLVQPKASMPEFALDKLAPYLRCGVCACRCQYRLSKVGGVAFSFANQGTKLEQLEPDQRLVQAPISDVAKSSYLVSKDYRLVVGGLDSERIMLARINPTLEKITGYIDPRGNRLLAMAKTDRGHINRAKRGLGKDPKRGKNGNVLNIPVVLRGQKPTTQVGAKPTRPPTRDGKESGNSRTPRSSKTAARGSSLDGRDGGKHKVRSLPIKASKREMVIPPVLGKVDISKRIATKNMRVDTTMPRKPPPIERLVESPVLIKTRSAKPGRDSKGKLEFLKDLQSKHTKRQVEAAGSLPKCGKIYRIATVQTRNILNDTTTKRMARVRCQLPVCPQRDHSDHVKDTSAKQTSRSRTTTGNNAKSAAKASTKNSKARRASGNVPSIKKEKISKATRKDVPLVVADNKRVHEDGKNPRGEKGKSKSSKANPGQISRIQLPTGLIHEAPRAHALQLACEWEESDSQGAQSGTESQSPLGYLAFSDQSVLSIPGLYGLGRTRSPSPVEGRTRLLSPVFCKQPPASYAAAAAIAQQGEDSDWPPLPVIRWESKRRHEHRARKLRSRSFTSISCDLHGHSRCDCTAQSIRSL
ncbi:hypothetical protein [Erinaceus virus H14]|nr:hypothetical protein [Erinaceus virus H14]